MDRLQGMAIFVAVAEEGGFAAAARRLDTSPPSVTRAVAELETRLGARLLHRTTRSVTVTGAGERFLADCRRILAEIDEAERHAAGIHAAPSGLVTVTGSVVFGREVLAPVLLALQARYPEIELSALFLDRVVNLQEEGVDIAVRIAELPDSALAAVWVGQVRHVLCAAPDYLAKHGRPETPADLARHDIISFAHETRRGEWVFYHDGKARGMRVPSRLRFNMADPAIAAAIAGRGIARVLSYMIAPHLESGALECVLTRYEPPPVPVHVVHREAGETSARVRAAVDFLVMALRRNRMIR